MSNKHFPELLLGDQTQTCSSENEMGPQVAQSCFVVLHLD